MRRLDVAYHAKPVVEAAAAVIAQGDLARLLYLQGYHEADMVHI